MKIIYTKHALEMLALRHLDSLLVKNCLTHPDIKTSGKSNKKIYLKEYGKNYLKVIVAEENNQLIIITLYLIAKNRIKS